MNNMGVAGGFNGMAPPAVNPFSYPSEICSECGSEVFVPGVIMKKVPGVLLGEGGVEFIPVPIKVAVCAKCGTLSPSDKKKYEEETKKAKEVEKTKTNSSGLII